MATRPLLLAASLVSSLLCSCSSRETPSASGAGPEPSAPLTEPAPRPPLEASEPAEAAPTAPAPAVATERPDVSRPPPWYVEMQRSYDQGMYALEAGKKEEALSFFDRVLAIQSTHKPAALMKSRILRELGRAGEGLEDVQAASDRHPRDLSLLEELAAVHLAIGEPEKALDVVARSLSEGGAVPGARYLRAVALAELKDREGALAALEDALHNGFVDLAVLEKDTRFEFIADDPRFEEVVQAMQDFRRAVEAAKR